MYGLRGNFSSLQPPENLQQGVTLFPSKSPRASPVFLETQTYWLLWKRACVCVFSLSDCDRWIIMSLHVWASRLNQLLKLRKSEASGFPAARSLSRHRKVSVLHMSASFRFPSPNCVQKSPSQLKLQVAFVFGVIINNLWLSVHPLPALFVLLLLLLLIFCFFFHWCDSREIPQTGDTRFSPEKNNTTVQCGGFSQSNNQCESIAAYWSLLVWRAVNQRLLLKEGPVVFEWSMFILSTEGLQMRSVFEQLIPASPQLSSGIQTVFKGWPWPRWRQYSEYLDKR